MAVTNVPKLNRKAEVPIQDIKVSAYTIPTETPEESDGTITWNSTTLVLVEATADNITGTGWSYASPVAAKLIQDTLAPALIGNDVMAVPACWHSMIHSVRNMGRPGICSMAIAAIDIALWDLKARILDLSLIGLLGAIRTGIPIYGSGGFTNYTIEQLQSQLSGWADQGIQAVKMKIGQHPDHDIQRVQAAREAIGPDVALYVDANGAYSHKQALAMAQIFQESNVSWFEEPVSSDNLDGLRFIRERAPAGMDIAAGEYGYDIYYFQRMLTAGAVDVLQADITRCGGITGFMSVSGLCDAFEIPLSGHTAPTIHAHVCCASKSARNLEYFYDQVRIENMLFDGMLSPVHSQLIPDTSRPGHGLLFKRSDAESYRVGF